MYKTFTKFSTCCPKLGVRVIVDVFQSVKVPNKHNVQTERFEVHYPISLMLLPEVPEKVDRILPALFAHKKVDVTNDGEGEPGGGEGEVAPYLGQIVPDVENYHNWEEGLNMI